MLYCLKMCVPKAMNGIIKVPKNIPASLILYPVRCKNSKNLRPQDILVFNSANKPSFQNPTKRLLGFSHSMEHWAKKAFCRIFKRWFIGRITGKNVQRLRIFAILASFLSGNLNVYVRIDSIYSKGYLAVILSKHMLSSPVWRQMHCCYLCFLE